MYASKYTAKCEEFYARYQGDKSYWLLVSEAHEVLELVLDQERGGCSVIVKYENLKPGASTNNDTAEQSCYFWITRPEDYWLPPEKNASGEWELKKYPVLIYIGSTCNDSVQDFKNSKKQLSTRGRTYKYM